VGQCKFLQHNTLKPKASKTTFIKQLYFSPFLVYAFWLR